MTRLAAVFTRSVLATAVLTALPAVGSSVEPAAAFRYDRSRTPAYLNEKLQTARTKDATDAAGVSSQIAARARRELAGLVDEILAGPWQPLYSDYSAAQAGGVAPGEWCFNRPGDYVRILSQAAPYLDSAWRAKVREYLRDLIRACPPTRHVFLPPSSGRPRSFRPTPAPKNPWLSDDEVQRRLFNEAYAVWLYADAWHAWAEVAPLFEDLVKSRAELAARGDFAPAYRPEHAEPLTVDVANDPEYRFRVYHALLAGFQDNYGYRGATEARRRMRDNRPVFHYVATLSALVGYDRLARRLGRIDESRQARETFDRVAAMTLGDKSAPFLWSDPRLSPEAARVIRDAAGPWLDQLARTPNVGNLPATDWDGKIVPGRRDYFAMNPYTWFHAWGGQGEGIRPHSVLGAYLAQAALLAAPPQRIADTLDIPWCKADLYYAAKLVALLQAAEGSRWAAIEELPKRPPQT